MVKYLLCSFIILFSFYSCDFQHKNNSTHDNIQAISYVQDTIQLNESGFLEIGLRNEFTGNKHGLWYLYLDEKLVRLESFQEGKLTGPFVEFVTDENGSTSIDVLAYMEDGMFNGPAVKLKSDSLVNIFDFFIDNKSVKSIFINGAGRVRITNKDTTYFLERMPSEK